MSASGRLINGSAGSGVAAANVLDGFQAVTGTTGATTLITVPAGRTWQGVIGANVTAQVVAAGTVVGQATCVFSTAGAGVTPPAGNLLQVEAFAAAGAAGGTTGSSASSSLAVPCTIVAPIGNAVQLQTTVTTSAAGGHSNAFAIGALL